LLETAELGVVIPPMGVRVPVSASSSIASVAFASPAFLFLENNPPSFLNGLDKLNFAGVESFGLEELPPTSLVWLPLRERPIRDRRLSLPTEPVAEESLSVESDEERPIWSRDAEEANEESVLRDRVSALDLSALSGAPVLPGE